MNIPTWKALHGKGYHNRPGINEIISFLPDDVGVLFQEFSRRLSHDFNAGCLPPKYTETYGWVYTFGRYNILLFNRVTIDDGAFTVQGIRVYNEESLKQALELATSSHDDYKERFTRLSALKKEKQAANTKKRIERERGELEAMQALIVKERFNKYRWSPKLSRQILKKLYRNDAMGIKDEELADEVGFALYARCLQGRDEGALKNEGKLKCHNCKEIINAVSHGGLMECKCGYQYIFRDYMRAFRTNNMPSGAATHIFNAFIDDWERAKGYAAKMRLIDNLIHEFHINLNSGVKGRFVGINLIEGTKKEIAALINELAYGGSI
jgi:hypothetical protein